MNGYEVMYFGAMAICGMGITVQYLNKKGYLLGGGKRYSTTPRYVRRWIPIEKVTTEEPVIVKVIDSGKRELASYLNTVRQTPFETYPNMTYDQLLATVTREEAESINDLKGFLL